MYFIGANVFVSIGTTVNPVILAAILIITGFSFWHIGRALDKLVIYGCLRGFSNKLKDVLAHPNSAELVERLYEGRSNTTESDKLVEGLASRVPVDKEDKHKHGLLYDLIRRFISRPIQNLDNQLSLQALSVEFASIAEIRERIDKARSLSSILPAVGLFGTLIGMFCAFVGADFQNPNMQLVMNELMKKLASKGFCSLLVEGGSELFGSLLKQNYVDRVVACVAPVVIGDKGKSFINGFNANNLAKAPRLSNVAFHTFDGDVIIEGSMSAS